MSMDEGREAARLCAVQLMSQMREACGGDLDKVRAILKIEAFVNSTQEFTEHPQVVNGCSDLLCSVFGSRMGAHSRFAVGCISLPLGVAVEVGAVIQVADDDE
mmetsp:Transcript_10945/g.27413  ORF Transcript_10945/g.27413 Transcript_10945/m.27413 type:complete len:103 (-) Transcript_10945:135-443(-)